MSSRELNEPLVSYKAEGHAPTPYQKAQEEWDERIGSARVQAKNWRLTALGLMAAVVVLSAGIVYLAGRSSVTPYVVEVNGDGSVRGVGPATQGYAPSRAVLQYFLGQFVVNVRSIPLDPVVAKSRWFSAYHYLRQSAANTLNEIMLREKPGDRIGQETVAVQIKNVVPLSKNSYQVRWEESIFNRDGIPNGSKSMTGLFTVELEPPTDEKAMKDNPLGLYIKQFNWSQDF